jgi:uncharacterized LabA/DUF88 family protein
VHCRLPEGLGGIMGSRAFNVVLFMDGTNLHFAGKALGFAIDFKRLLNVFGGSGTLLRAFYYTATTEDEEYSSVRPLVDWLDYNGFTVVTKPTREFIDAFGNRKMKGSMDVELAVDAMQLADQMDHMVLCSGNGDFRPLVEAVQRRGVRVTVVSTISTNPPIIADELRRQADAFVDLNGLRPQISRQANIKPRGRTSNDPGREPPIGNLGDIGQ